jgi:agmatine deiminase
MKKTYVLAGMIFLLLTHLVHAQVFTADDEVPEYFLKRYLSEAEMNMPVVHERIEESIPPTGPLRMVAEYDPLQAVLIRYPLGLPYSFIASLSQEIEVITIVSSNTQANQVLSLYNQNGVNTANCSFMVASTDSYWTRDYGPWFVFDGSNQPGIVDFPYNRPRPGDNAVPGQVANYLDIDYYYMNVEHTGGNLMVDGLGTAASTDLVYEENTNLTVAQIHQRMEDYLGVTDYDVTIDPLGDYIKHIDTWSKYLAPDKILIGQVPQSDPRYNDFEAVADYFANRVTPWGYPYKVYRVYTPGGSPATPYTNSLIANNRVFVPLTGSTWDSQAIAAYEAAMPGYEIIGINWNQWFNTDALHCRTREIADLGMLHVDHRPHFGELEWQDSLAVSSNITAISGEDLYADSLLIHYSINSGAYQQALMYESEEGFTGYIKNYAGGDTIRYYLYTADQSGRQTKHPIMGHHDPHWFVVGEQELTDLVVTPDTLYFIDDLKNSFLIQNPTGNAVQITGIENVSVDAAAMMTQLPAFPFELETGESLLVDVDIVQPVAGYNPEYDFYEEMILIESDLGDYEVVVMINKDLITSISNRIAIKGIKVYPNPFESQTVFDLNLIDSQHVHLVIFDLQGKLIATVHDGVLTKGGHKLLWDGLNNEQQAIHAGVYIYQLSLGEEMLIGKLLRR